MTFVYVWEREKWRTTMLLLWKRGPLKRDDGTGRSSRCQSSSIIKLICEYASPPWPTKPLKKLTMNLLDTYNGINQSYYTAMTKHQKYQSDGNFVMDAEHRNIVLNKRYQIMDHIGRGAFGVVVSALDLTTKTDVVIKITKAKRGYAKAAKQEVELVKALNIKDSEKCSNVVQFKEHFTYYNKGVGIHECLVFEKLNSNLYTLLTWTRYNGFSLQVVRKFCSQLLTSLVYLSRPDIRLIHADIKPENICLVHSGHSKIKLIDFGSALKEGSKVSTYIQSRYYRSPEVLLTYGYTVAIDIWSVACVCFEMYTGAPLFDGSNTVDQLSKIMACLGLPPDKMIERWNDDKRQQLFKLRQPSSPQEVTVLQDKNNNDLQVVEEQTNNKERKWVAVEASKVGVRKFRTLLEARPKVLYDSCGELDQFIDMLTKMLQYDPKDRLTAEEALKHPFFFSAGGVNQGYQVSVNGNASRVESSTSRQPTPAVNIPKKELEGVSTPTTKKSDYLVGFDEYSEAYLYCAGYTVNDADVGVQQSSSSETVSTTVSLPASETVSTTVSQAASSETVSTTVSQPASETVSTIFTQPASWWEQLFNQFRPREPDAEESQQASTESQTKIADQPTKVEASVSQSKASTPSTSESQPEVEAIQPGREEKQQQRTKMSMDSAEALLELNKPKSSREFNSSVTSAFSSQSKLLTQKHLRSQSSPSPP